MRSVRLLDPVGPVRLTLAAAGDIGIIGGARERAHRDGYDPALAGLAGPMRAADLGFANLEFPVGAPGWVRGGRSREFHHDEQVPAALRRAGVGVVSLANNHIMDCGPRGLALTRRTCEAAGLPTAGAGADLASARAPARLEVAGQKVVLLSYAAPSPDAARRDAPGFAPLDPAIVREDLARWRPLADVLVVSAHWGSMYVDFPPPRVMALAESLAAGGADAVIGHHPHVLQGARREGRCLTLFSLGDAAFNPRAGDFEARIGSDTRRDSGVFTVLVAERPGLDLTPLHLDDDGLPVTPTAERAASACARIERLSQGLSEARARFADESAPRLLRYELESLAEYLRRGRVDRVVQLLGGVRPRHLPLLWQALRRARRIA